ncbi:MAG: cobyrinate a,c-diamide synthase, partial [Pseudomonadota bacterium]
LFDGPASGIGSSADVARALGLPVVLVVKAERQSHSVAALAHGFMTFDGSVNVAGVILTRVASLRHEQMLRQALGRAGIACLGAIGRQEGMHLSSRHLGLTIAEDNANLAETITAIATRVEAGCDLAAIAGLSAVPPAVTPERVEPLAPLGNRIAIAEDRAFSFAYAHLLEGWHRAGASLHPFSPLAGGAPDPAADAVFLPGGYPELHADALAARSPWRDGLQQAAARGALIYGECGGYMALGKTLTDGDGNSHAMAGLLPIHTSFATRKRRLGYRTFTHDGALFPKRLKGHEFHYATIGEEGPALFEGADSAGTALGPMGTRLGRVAGSFAHIIDVAPDAG